MPRLHRRLVEAWGTVITIDCVGADAPTAEPTTLSAEPTSLDPIPAALDAALPALDAALPAIYAFTAQIDEVFSTWRSDSIISRRRRTEEAPSLLFDALSIRCEQARRISKGAFDPWRAPGGVDLSGYVKGWGAGMIADRLATQGLPNVCVNAAGDVAVRGSRAPGVPWSVGFSHPTDRTSLCATDILPPGYAAATSGFSERAGHIVNPHTGNTEVAALQASVIGPDPGLADALATALVVDGVAGSPWFHAFAAERHSTGETWQALVVEAGSLWRFGTETAPAEAS